MDTIALKILPLGLHIPGGESDFTALGGEKECSFGQKLSYSYWIRFLSREVGYRAVNLDFI